jgi:hypothetical protein
MDNFLKGHDILCDLMCNFFVTHFAHPQPNAGAAGGSLTEALLLGGWVGVFFWLHLVFKHAAIQ